MAHTAPHNDEAERVLLASCLYDNDLAADIIDVVRPEYFFSPLNAKTFNAITKLHDNGQPLDIAAILNELRADQCGYGNTTAFLTKLMDVPIASDIGYYKDILKEAYRKRLILKATAKADQAVNDDLNSIQILGQLQNDFFSIEGDGVQTGDISFGELVNRALEETEETQKSGSVGIKTGIYDLDREIIGLQDCSLNILCARPGMGKTSLGLQIARYAALKGHSVGFFSMEMSSKEIARRSVCAVAGVEYLKTLKGKLGQDELLKLLEAQEKLQGLSIHIDDTPGQHINEICRKTRRWKRIHNIELVVIDHMHLARSDTPENRTLMLTEISWGLKAIAKELEIPVLSLCQLNRGVEMRNVKRPQLSDLRDSGSIEQDADLVFGIYNESFYNDNADKHAAELMILKQRNGRVGVVRVGWNGLLMMFDNLARA